MINVSVNEPNAETPVEHILVTIGESSWHTSFNDWRRLVNNIEAKILNFSSSEGQKP